jgi:hypothetical protein
MEPENPSPYPQVPANCHLTYYAQYYYETSPLFLPICMVESRSQWPRGLRRGSAAARLLRSLVRISPGAWIFVCCDCCVLSGRGLCDELITRPQEYYQLWCVVVCDLETSRNEEAVTRVESQRHRKKCMVETAV